MARNDYNRMYTRKEETKLPVVETEVTPDEVIEKDVIDIMAENGMIEPVEEVPEVTAEPVEVVEEVKAAVEEKKEKNEGKVIGGASLNVRVNPLATANVVGTLTHGTTVTIKEDAGEFYKISYPIVGFVKKKFIEV